jgi:hypothetical protein
MISIYSDLMPNISLYRNFSEYSYTDGDLLTPQYYSYGRSGAQKVSALRRHIDRYN